MNTQTNTIVTFQKIASYIFNIGMITGLATLSFGLVSCGGGGGGSGSSGPGDTTPTITSIMSGSSYGVVAASAPKALSIYGTNFVNGMNLSIATSSGVTTGYTITASSVRSTTMLAVSAVIATAPSDNYVEFAIKSSSGTTTIASAALGVAGTAKTVTEIKTIFASANCTACHSAMGSGGLDLTSTPALYASGNKCSTKLRVTPGDPRRASSLLIDIIKATSTTTCYSLTMPPAGYSFSASDVQAVVDWVAGGAH